MAEPTFAIKAYKGNKSQVSWHGVSLADGEVFNSFMSKDVADRLHDTEGSSDFEALLRGLPSTGFTNDSIDKILTADIPEERGWAIGEAMAEAYLTRRHGIVWPWNMERDKRVPSASLPGADLVGFDVNGGTPRLAFGEVKTSGDANTPPGVMNGRSGMTHQIDNLANNLAIVVQLLKWLCPRCKAEHEEIYKAAVGFFINSGNKATALFGVLIRDTAPSELDLQARAKALSAKIHAPSTCQLIALYLPCAIADLPDRVSGASL